MADSDRGPGWERKPGNRVFRVPRVEPWRVLIPAQQERRSGQPSLRTLVYGFAAIVIAGTVLLMLPFASRSGIPLNPIDALFTSTSSVCVTGLVVVDTFDHWSLFGQVVILFLIQAGGFGYMTITTLFLLALGRRIGLRERLLIGESIGRVGDVRRLLRSLFIFTVASEVIGASVLYAQFSRDFPQFQAIWTSVFQSVSSFNNAGFDVIGGFQSLVPYQNNPLVILTTSVLIILGGISYLVLEDMFRRRRPRRFSVDTKMVLSVTAILLLSGTAIILITEYANPATLGLMSNGERVMNAFFQSVTSRTAGFNSFSTGAMSDYALTFTMILMFIGGASGSTAGGIKVGTFGLILSTMWSTINGREYPGAFDREFATSQIFRALALVMLAIGLVAIVVFFLSITEKFDFLQLLFETISAFGTVGLSTGITPGLSIGGRIIIIAMMFIGRLGPLTLSLALVQAQTISTYRYPKEIVRIG